jgi:hypothetical protein
LSRFYRVGQSALGYADANVVTRQETFNAIGLRPFSVSRLSVWQAGPGADLHVSWIRRTRIDGDSWSSVEVPVGEESEAYLVQIVAGSTTLREEHVTTPSFTYTPAMSAVDGVTVPFLIRVAQVSAIIGAGPGSEIQVDSL